MSREAKILEILQQSFQPQFLEVENESHRHAGPLPRETHFRVLIVSKDFIGLSRLQRQRKVNLALEKEFTEGLHALSLRALAPEEYQESATFSSPDCHPKRR